MVSSVASSAAVVVGSIQAFALRHRSLLSPSALCSTLKTAEYKSTPSSGHVPFPGWQPLHPFVARRLWRYTVITRNACLSQTSDTPADKNEGWEPRFPTRVFVHFEVKQRNLSRSNFLRTAWHRFDIIIYYNICRNLRRYYLWSAIIRFRL